jgi:hypothetical protein
MPYTREELAAGEGSNRTGDLLGKLSEVSDLKKQHEESLKVLKLGTEEYHKAVKAVLEYSEEIRDLKKELKGLVTDEKDLNNLINLTRKGYDSAKSSLGAYTTAVNTHIGTIDASIKEYRSLELAIRRLEDQVKGFNTNFARNQRGLEEIRTTLRLTRREYLDFLTVYSKSADLGIKVDQLKELGTLLTRVRGNELGIKMLHELTTGNIGGGLIKGLAKGDTTSLQIASRAGTRSQKQSMVDLYSSKDNLAGISEFRANVDRLASDLKESVMDTMNAMTFGLAAHLGPQSLLVAQSAGQLLTQRAILSRISVNGGGGGLGGLIGMGGKGAKMLTIGGLLAAGTYMAGDYISDNSKSESGARVGKSLKMVGGTAGGALTGAAVGSLIPGVGTAIGGVIGGLLGFMTTLNDTDLSLAEFGVGLTDQEKATRRLAKSITEIDQIGQEAVNALELAKKNAQDTTLARRGEFARGGLRSLAGGGGDLGGAIDADFSGKGAAFDFITREASESLAKLKEAYEREIQGKNPNDRAAIRESYNVQQMSVYQKVREQAGEAYSSEQNVAMMNEKVRAVTESTQYQVDLMTDQLNMMGLTLDGNRRINQLFSERVSLTESQEYLETDNLALIEKQKDFIKKDYEKRMKELAFDAEARKVTEQEYLNASRFLENQQAYVKKRLNDAKMGRITGFKESSTQTVAAGTENSAYKNIESLLGYERGKADSYMSSGRSSADIRNALSQIAASTKEQASILKEREARDINEINSKFSIASRGRSAEEVSAMEISKNQAIMEIRTRNIRAETDALRDSLEVSKVYMEKEKDLISVKRDSLEIEKDLADYLGSSYSTRFQIEGQLLDQQIATYNLTKQRMSEIEEIMRNTTDKAKYLPEYQQLQVQAAKESADITKSTLGRQRDFLDKALGRAFGVSSGSMINPILNDRVTFGEHMTNNGLNIGGGTATIGARERALMMRGAQRPIAPINGGQQALFQPNNPVPPPQMPGPQASTNDVSGNIAVTVSLDSALLKATIDKQIENSQRRGNA